MKSACLLKILAVWCSFIAAFLIFGAWANQEFTPDERAIFIMGALLLVLWVGLGGFIQWRWRSSWVEMMRRIALGWRVRFVLLCIGMALIEEAITTGLTNLGPTFGAETDEAAITASKNYLEVVLLHSVMIFVPMFITWAWMLGRWEFKPHQVMLLFGITGWLAETMSFGPQNLFLMGMWVYVYGLMVWLPAQTIPPERLALPPRWYQWPLAVILPILCSIPFVLLMLLLRSVLGMD